MNRKELQQALKPFKTEGLTAIKLTAKTEELQAEFNGVASCQIGFTPISEPEPTVTEVTENDYQGTELEHFEGVIEDDRGIKRFDDSIPIYPQCPLTCEHEEGWQDWIPHCYSKHEQMEFIFKAADEGIRMGIALEACYEDSEDLLSSEGLNTLLSECHVRLFGEDEPTNFIYPCLESIPLAYLACIHEQAFTMLSPEKQYCAIRDEIFDLARDRHISGYSYEDFDCMGIETRQMKPLQFLQGQDNEAEVFAKKHVCERNARLFCYMARASKYKLSRVTFDKENQEVHHSASFSQIKQLASTASLGWLDNDLINQPDIITLDLTVKGTVHQFRLTNQVC